jgi:hypothetical protein
MRTSYKLKKAKTQRREEKYRNTEKFMDKVEKVIS